MLEAEIVPHFMRCLGPQARRPSVGNGADGRDACVFRPIAQSTIERLGQTHPNSLIRFMAFRRTGPLPRPFPKIAIMFVVEIAQQVR